MARKEIEFTNNSEQKIIDYEEIRRLSQLGMDYETIAYLKRIDVATLRNKRKEDPNIDAVINQGKAESQVEQRVDRRAMWKKGNWKALEHAMDTDHGIRATKSLEHSGPNKSPIQIEAQTKIIDDLLSKIPEKDLKAIRGELNDRNGSQPLSGNTQMQEMQ